MDLNESLLDDLDLWLDHLDGKLDTGRLGTKMLRATLDQVAIVDVIERQRLNNSQASVVLVDAKDLFELFLPCISIDGA